MTATAEPPLATTEVATVPTPAPAPIVVEAAGPVELPGGVLRKVRVSKSFLNYGTLYGDRPWVVEEEGKADRLCATVEFRETPRLRDALTNDRSGCGPAAKAWVETDGPLVVTV